MKLALSGSSSIGKTTLAKALAEQLSLNLIEEEYQALFQTGVFDGPKKQLALAFEKTRHHKQSLEKQSNGHFITDRCPIDLFHLWMVKGLNENPSATEQFFKNCHEQFKQYDFIIIPPWGALKLEPLSPEQSASQTQTRVMDPLIQLRNHATIVGYTHMWIDKKKIIEIPHALINFEERLQFVLKQIKNRSSN